MMVQERDGHVRQVRRRGTVRRVAHLLMGLLPRRMAGEAQRQEPASYPLALQRVKLRAEP